MSANGSQRAASRRNVALITMDLDDVETLDVAMLWVAPTCSTVHDLTGTDLTLGERRTLRRPAAVGDDGAADTVVVNGTAGDDAFVLTDAGSAVNVNGVAAQVNITGSTAALDRLTVNGLAGTDSFSVTPGVSTLIQLSLVP